MSNRCCVWAQQLDRPAQAVFLAREQSVFGTGTRVVRPWRSSRIDPLPRAHQQGRRAPEPGPTWPEWPGWSGRGARDLPAHNVAQRRGECILELAGHVGGAGHGMAQLMQDRPGKRRQ